MARVRIISVTKKEINPYRPVHVSWTKGVSDWEAHLVVEGMKDMLQFVKLAPQIKVFGSGSWLPSSEPYSSPDWYQDHNLIQLTGRPRQVDANGVARDLKAEPWRRAEDHIDLMIVDRDLNVQMPNPDGKLEWINFIFGLAHPLWGSIQSLFRFRQELSGALYQSILGQIGRHEYGHVLGLVRRATSDKRGGLYQSHCPNFPCTMNQMMDVQEAINLIRTLKREGIILCPECIAELRSPP